MATTSSRCRRRRRHMMLLTDFNSISILSFNESYPMVLSDEFLSIQSFVKSTQKHQAKQRRQWYGCATSQRRRPLSLTRNNGCWMQSQWIHHFRHCRLRQQRSIHSGRVRNGPPSIIPFKIWGKGIAKERSFGNQNVVGGQQRADTMPVLNRGITIRDGDIYGR